MFAITKSLRKLCLWPEFGYALLTLWLGIRCWSLFCVVESNYSMILIKTFKLKHFVKMFAWFLISKCQDRGTRKSCSKPRAQVNVLIVNKSMKLSNPIFKDSSQLLVSFRWPSLENWGQRPCETWQISSNVLSCHRKFFKIKFRLKFLLQFHQNNNIFLLNYDWIFWEIFIWKFCFRREKLSPSESSFVKGFFNGY